MRKLQNATPKQLVKNFKKNVKLMSELDGGKTATYFGNRSAAYFMIATKDALVKSIEDCMLATKLDPKMSKVWVL